MYWLFPTLRNLYVCPFLYWESDFGSWQTILAGDTYLEHKGRKNFQGCVEGTKLGRTWSLILKSKMSKSRTLKVFKILAGVTSGQGKEEPRAQLLHFRDREDQGGWDSDGMGIEEHEGRVQEVADPAVLGMIPRRDLSRYLAQVIWTCVFQPMPKRPHASTFLSATLWLSKPSPSLTWLFQSLIPDFHIHFICTLKARCFMVLQIQIGLDTRKGIIIVFCVLAELFYITKVLVSFCSAVSLLPISPTPTLSWESPGSWQSSFCFVSHMLLPKRNPEDFLQVACALHMTAFSFARFSIFCFPF